MTLQDQSDRMVSMTPVTKQENEERLIQWEEKFCSFEMKTASPDKETIGGKALLFYNVIIQSRLDKEFFSTDSAMEQLHSTKTKGDLVFVSCCLIKKVLAT